ncbi:Fumarylacetoacetase [Xylogone sp. PMI_703]|nr:Fumarylacetoacetase [Xylogone sp. PMI_703]
MGLSATKWDSMPFLLRPPTTSLVGPGPTVELPPSTQQFDWECELAVVVGCKLHHASVEEVLACGGIAGYTMGLDLSCRDLAIAPNELKVDLMRGKAQDTMAPCGPVIVPVQFLDNGLKMKDAAIKLWVNGELMMDARTSEMLYSVEEQLSIISNYIALEPGDILFTGSPSGSAKAHGGCWLKKGDKIRAEIEGIEFLEVSIRDT